MAALTLERDEPGESGKKHISIYLAPEDHARAETVAYERRTPLATSIAYLVKLGLDRWDATTPSRRR